MTAPSGRRAQDLYRRYMAAAKAYRGHAVACTACGYTGPGPACPAGKRLFESLSVLQLAYISGLP
ncbi:hypothetical protein [Streptomyces sp. NPDC094049]|uniref:hypothetical protein n=1 Tax=Streptomyces sp. NPDC094049 TaxID=3154987 RepID=UPI003324B7FB